MNRTGLRRVHGDDPVDDFGHVEVLPVLYLRGISTKDFVPTLAEFFGSEAGLSASTVQRLTREWGQELDGGGI